MSHGNEAFDSIVKPRCGYARSGRAGPDLESAPFPPPTTKNMKIQHHIIKLTGGAFTAMLLTSASLYAEPGPKPLQHLTRQEQVSALTPGSKVVMICAKCKTVQIAEVDKKHGILGWFQPKTKHLCPGCGGYIQLSLQPVKGNVHTCSKCGSESAFCCGGSGGKM